MGAITAAVTAGRGDLRPPTEVNGEQYDQFVDRLVNSTLDPNSGPVEKHLAALEAECGWGMMPIFPLCVGVLDVLAVDHSLPGRHPERWTEAVAAFRRRTNSPLATYGYGGREVGLISDFLDQNGW